MEPLLLLARWGSPDTMGMLGRGGAAAGPMSALAEASEVAAMMSDLDDGMINVLLFLRLAKDPARCRRKRIRRKQKEKASICRPLAHQSDCRPRTQWGGHRPERGAESTVRPQIGRWPTCHAANRPYLYW